jgi:hypothetical protein
MAAPRLVGPGLLAVLALTGARQAMAEPAFAVRSGYRCSQCHVNRTGGGMRTPFGSLYAQTVLPAHLLRLREDRNLLPADPDALFAVGADARFQVLSVDRPDTESTLSTEVTEANLYGEARLLPGRLSLYLDVQAGPGGSSAREVFGVFSWKRGNGYLKAGKILPPFGFRLPDDAVYIRQFTGFTYSAPDTGVEIGWEPGRLSVHLAAVNGASGGAEEDRSKQFSLLMVQRIGKGRIGVSASNNISGGARTTQAGMLGAINLGRVAVLAEGDWRETRQDGIKTRLVGFLEADLLLTRGLNLKLAHDWTDPDRDVRTDARARDSLGLEWVPYPFVQLRLFARRTDGPPQVPGARGRQFELEAHVFF